MANEPLVTRAFFFGLIIDEKSSNSLDGGLDKGSSSTAPLDK